MLRFVYASALLATLIVLPAQFASTQEAAPKGNVGFSTVRSQFVDLGPEIDGMQDRQLRMRILRIAPGGHIGKHSHANRPAVVYALKGVDTVTLGDGTQVVLKPGDMWDRPPKRLPIGTRILAQRTCSLSPWISSSRKNNALLLGALHPRACAASARLDATMRLRLLMDLLDHWPVLRDFSFQGVERTWLRCQVAS
jgi:quercetin dioxygenase-like cupin family protein